MLRIYWSHVIECAPELPGEFVGLSACNAVRICTHKRNYNVLAFNTFLVCFRVFLIPKSTGVLLGMLGRWNSLGAVSIRKTVLLGMAIPMLKIRRPLGRLIFNMGIAIPGKTVFLIETAPWIPKNVLFTPMLWPWCCYQCYLLNFKHVCWKPSSQNVRSCARHRMYAFVLVIECYVSRASSRYISTNNSPWIRKRIYPIWLHVSYRWLGARLQ